MHTLAAMLIVSPMQHHLSDHDRVSNTLGHCVAAPQPHCALAETVAGKHASDKRPVRKLHSDAACSTHPTHENVAMMTEQQHCYACAKQIVVE
jgi:hypothetical protein